MTPTQKLKKRIQDWMRKLKLKREKNPEAVPNREYRDPREYREEMIAKYSYLFPRGF